MVGVSALFCRAMTVGICQILKIIGGFNRANVTGGMSNIVEGKENGYRKMAKSLVERLDFWGHPIG